MKLALKLLTSLGVAAVAIAVHADVINDDITTCTNVEWSTEGHLDNSPIRYVQHLVITGDTDFKRLGFNQFARRMEMLNPADTLIEIVPGYYAIASPRFGAKSDTVKIDIMTYGRLINRSYAPDGFHRVNHDGTTEPVRIVRHSLDRPATWQYLGRDEMVYGPTIYDLNESLTGSAYTPGAYDIIPSYKHVTLTGDSSTVRHLAFMADSTMTPEHYRIIVRNDSLIIHSRAEDQWMAYLPFQFKVLRGNEKDARLPNAVIENYPDMAWRGLMIDIARNYQTPETMHRILLLMAVHHLNRLHFHITDDEAWRLEIPGLPELTDVASRRGYSIGRDDILPQIFAGDGDPDSRRGSANGYFTRQEFIDLIKHANTLGIQIIPEIESPGHARAAIRAMERRHQRGDDTYRLIHDGDTSRYTSAQSFHDNVMNPALPGPYRFMEKVIDEINAMYNEAGVSCPGIHIGGDEVAKGAWNGSEVAQRFMADNNIPNQHELHAHFVTRVSKMLADRSIPMHGWQEVALGHSPEYNEEVLPRTGGINCWSTLAAGGHADVTDRALRGGWPVILSNVDHLYFDLAYTTHPQEPGLRWGGTTDEFTAFEAYPSKLCPASDSMPGVIGLNAHLFAETIRSPQQLYTYLIPKIMGLSERAWNTSPTYTRAQFNTIIDRNEMPLWRQAGMSGHVRQPGIKVIDGMVYLNSPFSDAVIRYTLDDTDPDENSPIYTAPFAMDDTIVNIRATVTAHGKTSLPTLLHP